jgi:AraC-like DNA-binding protein
MDPLADIIALLRPSTAVSKPISARGDWGVSYAAHGMPGFALVLEGECWLALDGGRPVHLERGDFILLPATPAFTLSRRPNARCRPAEPSDRPVRHGDADGAPDFRMLGGSFRIDGANAPLLLSMLPELIHIRPGATPAGRLSPLIALLGDECEAARPGGDAIVRRLLDIILIEALRYAPADAPRPQPGLLAGLREPALAKALGALHDDVRRRWTVAELATIAGMSRSAFAIRFLDVVDCAPIEYLSRWRMAIAKASLLRGDIRLDRLAERIGYESASAFSTAFRRRFGCPPGAFARGRAS